MWFNCKKSFEFIAPFKTVVDGSFLYVAFKNGGLLFGCICKYTLKKERNKFS